MLLLFFFMMIALLAAFYFASRLIRIEYECHPDIWADDGKPADYFAQVRGSYMARMAVSTAWLFVTPDWMKSKSNARHMVMCYRVLRFAFFAGCIVMVFALPAHLTAGAEG